MRQYTAEEIVERGIAAERIIKDEAVQAVFDEMYENLHAQIDRQPTDKPDEVMSVVRQLRAINAIKSKLETYTQQGNYEQNLNEQRSKRDTGGPQS